MDHASRIHAFILGKREVPQVRSMNPDAGVVTQEADTGVHISGVWLIPEQKVVKPVCSFTSMLKGKRASQPHKPESII